MLPPQDGVEACALRLEVWKARQTVSMSNRKSLLTSLRISDLNIMHTPL